MAKKAKKKSGKNPALKLWFLFGLIILAALVLRLWQADWSPDRQFHPDERWIVGDAVRNLHYLDFSKWPPFGRPVKMQYGSLPLYILGGYNNFLNDLVRNSWVKNFDTNKALIQGSRIISGLFDTGTIVFIFLAALLLFGSRQALFAAALLAFIPLHIHSAHFATVDTFTAFFIAGLVYFSARIYKYGTMANYIIAGIFLGASLASKISAAPAALIILAAHFLYYFTIKGKTGGAKEDRLQSWINLGWAAAASFGSFFLFMPYAILDFNSFMADTNEQRRILITGEGDVPYTRQYWNTMPYLYYLKNLVLYTMGIPLGTVSLFAFFFYIFTAVKKALARKMPDAGVLLVLAWALPYLLIVGASFGKFNRYMLLFTPFLALLTGKFVYDFEAWVREKKWAGALKVFVMAGAMFYGLAFMNVYTNSHTWIQASSWIYRNIPEVSAPAQPAVPGKRGVPAQPAVPAKQTVILNEEWGDDLPVYADGKGSWIYRITKWRVQEPDGQNKLFELSAKLNEADYVAMADKRAYGTYLRLPKNYPMNYFYYHTMLNAPEKLGYKRVYEKAVYPSLFGINIKDDKADESFQLYDHPHVYIFKNESRLTPGELKAILASGEQEIKAKFGQQAPKGTPAYPSKVGTNNPNIGQIKDTVISLMPVLSIFIWYLLVQLLAFIALPLHFKILGNLRDKGYGLAKVTGIFLFAWINWILVSAGLWKFYQVNLWILLAALAGISFLVYRANAAQAMQFARENKKQVLFTEIAFLAAYLFFVIVKLWCPDIHSVMGQGYNGGGEPMGMAYLSAIFNDVKFPPHDPWLAGFTLNYYYWGQLVLATLSKVLGFFPRVTYNLSLALLFALCFTAAYTLVYNLTGKYKYALLGGFLLALAGNFHTMVFTLEKLANAGNIMQFFMQLGSFQFIWDPTRIYPTPVITELPFFSYLYGDLHAHNIVIPFTVLAMALVYNMIKAGNRTMNIMNSLGAGLPSQLLSGFMLALGLGSMMAINTWNFPAVLILVAAAFCMIGFNLYRENFRPAKKINPVALVSPAAWTLLALAVIGAVSYTLFLPFHSNFQSPYATVPRLISKMERAPLEVMFRFFSVFFFVIFTWMFFVWSKGAELVDKKTGLMKLKMRRFNMDKIMDHIERVLAKITRNPAALLRFAAAASAAVVFLLLLLMQATFAFLFLMSITCLWVMFTTRVREEIFAMLLLLVSVGMIWGTEIFFIADGRMNTVFKFYMVAWTFLAIFTPYLLFRVVEALQKVFKDKKYDRYIIAGSAAAYVVVIVVLRIIESRSGGSYSQAFFVVTMLMAPLMLLILKDALGKYIFTGALLFLLLPAALYPVLGAAFKMNICSNAFKQGPSIDGMKYMENLVQRQFSIRDFDKYDYRAMEWINTKMKEITPILEAPGMDMYTGVSRISIFTGMPTLVGWGYQVGQQSGRGNEVSMNNQLASAIYTSQDVKYSGELMKKAGLKYYYIGSLEKAVYPGCDRLAAIGDAVYRNEVSALYKLKDGF